MHMRNELIQNYPGQLGESPLAFVGTPAHVAARAGNLEAVQALFKRGTCHNMTNGEGQLVESVVLEEMSHHSSPRYQNQAPKIIKFLIDHRRQSGSDYPRGMDLGTQVNDLLRFWANGLKNYIEHSVVKLREVLLVYLNEEEAKGLFQGPRSFLFLWNFGWLMETAQDKSSIASDLAELCLEVMDMFPDMELVDPEAVRSLVRPFLFSSSKLSSAHLELARKLANVGARPCHHDLPVIFFDWLKDPKRRECYSLRDYRSSFLLADMQPALNSAWERAVEIKNRGAVEELAAFWPHPSRLSAEKIIAAAFGTEEKPVFLKEVLSLDFDPACPNTDGTFLHMLVNAFIRCNTYPLKQAKEHAEVLLNPTANRRAIDPLVKDSKGNTASDLFGNFDLLRNNWYQLQNIILRYENKARNSASIHNMTAHGEHQTIQGEEMDLD